MATHADRPPAKKHKKKKRPNSDGTPHFAHPSEAETAKILDFYQIEWQYEPRTFPIEWDKRGRVIQSFTPDFYLPELNLYIELTTLNQRLVTKKNRKVRRLRELYPDIQIKIFYQRDFKSLLFKYGGTEVLADGEDAPRYVAQASHNPTSGQE